jgi:plastocyanin
MSNKTQPSQSTSNIGRRGVVGAAFVAVLALSACGGSDDAKESGVTEPASNDTVTAAPAETAAPDAPAGADSGAITIADFAFGESISVGTGATVTVTNADSVGHTWTSDDGLFASGFLEGGDSFQFDFAEAGEFAFFCEIHPSMAGTITVTG